MQICMQPAPLFSPLVRRLPIVLDHGWRQGPVDALSVVDSERGNGQTGGCVHHHLLVCVRGRGEALRIHGYIRGGEGLVYDMREGAGEPG